MKKLFIIEGADRGKSFELTHDTLTIGRAPDCAIQLTDTSVSRVHATISPMGSSFLITDTGSKNGTVIRGKRLPPNEPRQVPEGMPIFFGNIIASVGEEALPADELSVIESIDLSRELTDEDMAALDSIDLSQEVSEEALPEQQEDELHERPESFLQDRPLTAQKNMELIYRVSSALMESLHADDNINEILETILNYILDLLKRVDRGAFILVDEHTGKISGLIPILKKSGGDTIRVYSRTIVDRVIREGRAVSMLDTRREDEADLSESMQLMKIKSVMCVPLISRSKIRGVIYIDSVTQPHGFRREDLSLLTALSIPAAYAIENALLSSKDSDAGQR
jgi:pSer/pThr/pTyr-binding forkhead associated (FHA) protein